MVFGGLHCSVYETIVELDRIRVFTLVVQFGSFSKAAERLGIPKSKASRWVSELEATLGARLLSRTTRQLSLTEAGRMYFERTSGPIAALEAADRALSQLQEEPSGTLKLTAPTDLVSTVLTPVFVEFNRLYPRVKLVVLATNRRVDLVAEGVDLALRAGALSDSSMVARKLPMAQMGLFASPAYLQRCGEPQTLRQLQAHNCLVFGHESSAHRWELIGTDGPQSVRVQGPLCATDYGTLASACLAGMGIAQLPSVNMWEGLSEGRLVSVLPTWKGSEVIAHVIYPSLSHLSPAVKRFNELLVAHLKRTTALRGE